LLFAELPFDAPAQTPATPEEKQRVTFSISNTTKNVRTKETATRQVDGLPITYPVDEADVVELLLPSITKYRAERRAAAKVEAEALIAQFANPEVRERYRVQLPKLLSLEPAEDQSFDRQYDAALARVNLFFRQWEKWSGDLSRVNFWNRTSAEGFVQDKRVVFPEISYQGSATGETEFTISPSYTKKAFGFDLIQPAKGADPVAGLESFRLDLPLFYAPGTSADALAASQRELLEGLPNTLTRLGHTLVMPAEQGLTEELIEWEIRTRYFTAQAAATPKGTMLIRALTRYYLISFMKAVGKMDGDAEMPMMTKILFFDLPEGVAARAELLRDFEALDPFSEDAPDKVKSSRALSDAGSRFAAYVLINFAQGGESAGRGLLQFLRDSHVVPAGGFASVSDFRTAVEAAYAGKLEPKMLEARVDFTASIRARSAQAPNAEAAPKPQPQPPQAAELPDRQTQNLEGITITSPASLAKAVAKLAPEWAALLAKARQRLNERFAQDPAPPVPIAEGTLAMLRGQGLPVTREKADLFAMEAAFMANAGQMLKGIYQGKAVQVWFKSDLRRLLQEGRSVPGFSYEAKDDIVRFEAVGKGHLTIKIDKDKPLTGQSVVEAFSKWPPPVYPVVLKDDSIAQLTDLDTQVAKIRAADIFMRPMMEAAGTVSPAQLGIKENNLFHGRLLTPAQSLFSSVHELVEDDLALHVIASPDRRWFCEGLANLLAMRACEAQFGQDEAVTAGQVFASLYEPALLRRRAAEVDLLGWASEESQSGLGRKDDELAQAHYYYATRVLMAAVQGRGDGFLKTWLAKIHETPWNRTNAATIIAAYDALTGKSLREIIKTTTAGNN
jgi:hypothetical protein